MNLPSPRIAVLAASMLAVGLAGCSQYVKKDDFSAAIQQLQQKQQDQQQQIDSIKQQMQEQFSKYDTQITAMQGRVSVDTVAHFAFNSATLNDQDKPALQNFAQTISKYHPNVLITVEGFADPAGSREAFERADHGGRLRRPGRLARLQPSPGHAARRRGARLPGAERHRRRPGACSELRQGCEPPGGEGRQPRSRRRQPPCLADGGFHRRRRGGFGAGSFLKPVSAQHENARLARAFFVGVACAHTEARCCSSIASNSTGGIGREIR